MSDLFGNPEDRFSHDEAHTCELSQCDKTNVAFLPSKDSDQHGHLLSLIRDFTDKSLGSMLFTGCKGKTDQSC